jgi:hypothetical protein
MSEHADELQPGPTRRPDVVGLILRFEELSQRDPERRYILNQRTPSPGGRRNHSVLGAFFIVYALRMPSVPALQRAFDSLDTAPPNQAGIEIRDGITPRLFCI